MNKWLNLLKERVLKRREQLGISQGALGEKIGATSAQMTQWLTGQKAIRYEKVCEMAEALDWQPWQLLKGEGLEQSPLLTQLIPILKALNETELQAVLNIAKLLRNP